MDNKKIKVEFNIESAEIIEYFYNPNDKIKDVCQRLAKDKKLDFKTAIFLFSGNPLDKEKNDEPISKYANINPKINILLIF